MKKFRRIAYIILISIIVILSLNIYTNANKNDKEDQKEKALTEIRFLESKLINLFNTMNNIEYENYKISASEISKQQQQNSSSENSSSAQGGQQGGNTSKDGGNGSGNQATDNASQTQNKKFGLQSNGVLLNNEQINWDSVKSEVEILYSSIPTITLELYQLDLNQDDILNFNKEFDNLTKVIQEENKEKTLDMLSKLYEYIPKFAKNATEDEIYKISLEVKNNIYKAYAKLDTDDWGVIDQNIKSSIEAYSKLLSNTNIDTNKQYIINKAYVMINELQNAVNLKDKTIFLIKYKNLLEELSNI